MHNLIQYVKVLHTNKMCLQSAQPQEIKEDHEDNLIRKVRDHENIRNDELDAAIAVHLPPRLLIIPSHFWLSLGLINVPLKKKKWK